MIRAASRRFASSAATRRPVSSSAPSTLLRQQPQKQPRRTVGKTVLYSTAGTVALVGTGTFAYLQSESGAGAKRQLTFWSYVAPVVADYAWNLSQRSPYVRYQDWSERNRIRGELSAASETDVEAEFQRQRKQRRAKITTNLHKEHAPHLYQCLLQLKGLYVKLGQVLSVTTLPVPDEYRALFKQLQSNVPGHAEFDTVILPVLEKQFGALMLKELFESIDPEPCGAASIGQAHKATVRRTLKEDDGISDSSSSQTVIIKVQYPDAHWQVPADIVSVGQFLRLCVYFGVVDESSATLSYREFSRQFLAELDYRKERDNLETIYQSSLDPESPYQKHGVVVPKVLPDLCSPTILTMTYLPGPKLEEEARKQLEALGIDTNKGLRSVVMGATKDLNTDGQNASASQHDQMPDSTTASDQNVSIEEVEAKEIVDTMATESKQKTLSSHTSATGERSSIVPRIAQFIGNTIGFDSVLWAVRFARQIMLWSTAAAVKGINVISAERMPTRALVPQSARDWAEAHQTAAKQAKRISLTRQWIRALFDVHGHQIFSLGLFNADPHPGNILVIEDEDDSIATPTMSAVHTKPQLGLIDFGQCKRLTTDEQYRVATLLLRVANDDTDEAVAAAFRAMGVRTKNDSTKFLADFARLMFGPLQPYHLNHEWHKQMHKRDGVTYFPNELGMVYRTSMLLRGLAVSLQWNVSIGDMWKEHAQATVDRHAVTATVPASVKQTLAEDAHIEARDATIASGTDIPDTAPPSKPSPNLTAAALARRTTRAVVEDITETKTRKELV